VPRQPNYYRILDVTLQADQAQVQHAYRALAKRYHPDLVPRERREWARAQMARINAAYEVLGDPARRAIYDRKQGYVRSGVTTAARAQKAAPRSRQRQAPNATRGRPRGSVAANQRTRWRHERRRREWLSRQRTVVLCSLVALGILLLGALYWWRALAPALPQHRWAWAVLLSLGLGLVLVILARAAR
jgi:DnaJ-class molecular chaperone